MGSRKSNEKVTSLLFPSTLKEVRRVKMLALEMEEVHWCALVLMAGFLESPLLLLPYGQPAYGILVISRSNFFKVIFSL